jgi:anaerobic ribonucleoside-triphosphate reductase activating protein
MLNLAGELKNSNANGPGLRYVIFTQGCSHPVKCEGCHNSHTWEKRDNMLITVDEMALDIVSEMPLINGVTFSGGEPFDQAAALTELAIKLKSAGLSVMCYTGYTYEQIRSYAVMRSMEFTQMNRLLDNIDILVDGKFDINQIKCAGLYRGSANQRMLYLEKGQIIKIE